MNHKDVKNTEKYYTKHADTKKNLVITGVVKGGEGQGADVITEDNRELNTILTDFIGKKVKITIEFI